jgi:hypothetical protein
MSRPTESQSDFIAAHQFTRLAGPFVRVDAAMDPHEERLITEEIDWLPAVVAKNLGIGHGVDNAAGIEGI